jgi:hypothetical protein
MNEIRMRKFESIKEFASTVAGLFAGPTFLMTFLKTEGSFREQVILTVSFTNNCGV